jgi:endonuclease-3
VESQKQRMERAAKIVAGLAEWYPDSTGTPLAWHRPLELLLATILAAQARDDTVNLVMPNLLARFPDAAAIAGAPTEDVEAIIRTTGFFRAKARSLRACCRQLVDLHGGEVPGTMEALTALPGVGRKTANVVLGNCFGVPGLVVDTHVLRVSRRWELTAEEDAEKVESDLCGLVPRSDWTSFSHRVTWFGRLFCTARNPRCPECRLRSLCPFVPPERAGAAEADSGRSSAPPERAGAGDGFPEETLAAAEADSGRSSERAREA